MPHQVPDWLLQMADENPNLVEDSPTFRAVEATQQKRNLVKATNQALKQHADEVKKQQISAITTQIQALKEMKDKTDAIHKSLPDFGAQSAGPATNMPPKDPETVPGPGDEPSMPSMGDNPPVMPGMHTQPYAPDAPPAQPGDIPGNKFMPDQPQAPNMSPPGATPFEPNDMQRMADSPQEQDPAQTLSVEDVMQLSQATGLSPQQVASMVLMGDTVLKNQPPEQMNAASSMPEPAPQIPPQQAVASTPSLPEY